VILIDAAETERQLPFATRIPALRDLFVSGCVVPPRHQHRIDLSPEPEAVLLLMPARKPNDALGVKIVNVFPGNNKLGLPGLHSLYCLFDADHGTPIAVQESGDLLQPMRSGVFSADRLAGTLADLCAGRQRGRVTTEEVTLFKAVGTAMSDLAAAMVVRRGQDGAGSAHA
jgi:ornithine cyclodeaminase/alanine dehydrogenase-like protein (mu-crystallin family)